MDALQVQSLTRRFGRVVAVRELSFGVEQGEIYGLLGPNGSGKTTTLACALGLLRPSSGSATVLGHDARHIHRTRGRVGVVFDGTSLLGRLSARNNLEYARRLIGHRRGRSAQDVLQLVGLGEHARRAADKLSLGQKKRLAIARALLGDPELVVLDEPLSALDALGVRTMLALFRRLRDEGITLLLSSHRLHEMETVVTRAGVLAGGRLLREGTLDDLLETGKDTWRLRVAPPQRAVSLLQSWAETEVLDVRPLETDAGGASELRLGLRQVPAEEVNRRLVEAGCAVSELTSERGSLHRLFERLVDESSRSDAREPLTRAQ